MAPLLLVHRSPLLLTVRTSRPNFVFSHRAGFKLQNDLLGHQLHYCPSRQPHKEATQASRTCPFVGAAAQLSELVPTTAAVYGGVLLVGGLFAYTRTSSKGSLFGGLSGGALLGLAFALMIFPDTKDVGDAIGFGTALLFTAVFGIRFASTRKIFPAAPLLVLSIAASAIFVGAYLQDRVL